MNFESHLGEALGEEKKGTSFSFQKYLLRQNEIVQGLLGKRQSTNDDVGLRRGAPLGGFESRTWVRGKFKGLVGGSPGIAAVSC